ncbi:hypothetical protein A6770_28455 [Nostoc minutum NIES-26]|uniref:Uncharacterized protein n=1 Tax=Nostoc minutum NIES-26 TaxID=1844469 RepID=A0A367QM87_9NOSO|nr:hypothetical protein A6770_28455 [Nostoc minutum NIES-26]
MLTTKANPSLSSVLSVSVRLTANDRQLVEQLFNSLRNTGICETRSEFIRLAIDELATKYAEEVATS